VLATGTTVCSGQSGNITAVGNGGNGGPYNYNWNTGGTGSPLSVSPASNTVYSVTATDGKGCVSASDTAVVTIAAPLTVSVTSKDTTCAGQPATLSAAVGGGTGTYTLTWSPGGSHNPTLNVNPTTTTIYTASVIGSCPLGVNATGQVTVLTNPTINFNPNPASGCAPVCVTFAAAASSVPGNNIISYFWDFGDGSTANGLNVSHCYTVSGSLPVYLLGITQKGCRDSVVKNNLITVFSQPVADFGASNFITDVYEPDITFYDLSTGNVNSWNWDFSSGTSSAQNPTYTFPEGTYEVTLIVQNINGCSDTVTKEVKVNPVYSFYAPNAFTPNFDGNDDVFLPTGEAWDNTSFNLWVFDRWGNMIFHSGEVNKGWDGTRLGSPTQEDVYVWKVELSDIFGRPHEYNGTVSLVK
jgi:gliding motility-associated-like protein